MLLFSQLTSRLLTNVFYTYIIPRGYCMLFMELMKLCKLSSICFRQPSTYQLDRYHHDVFCWCELRYTDSISSFRVCGCAPSGMFLLLDCLRIYLMKTIRAPSQYTKRRLFVRSRSHEIGTLNCRIALTFDRHTGSTAAEVPVKFQSERTILNTNLAASRLYEILRKDVFSDIETGPRLL